MNLLLSPELEANEIAEVLLRDCGIEKAQKIHQEIEKALDKKIGELVSGHDCKLRDKGYCEACALAYPEKVI